MAAHRPGERHRRQGERTPTAANPKTLKQPGLYISAHTVFRTRFPRVQADTSAVRPSESSFRGPIAAALAETEPLQPRKLSRTRPRDAHKPPNRASRGPNTLDLGLYGGEPPPHRRRRGPGTPCPPPYGGPGRAQPPPRRPEDHQLHADRPPTRPLEGSPDPMGGLTGLEDPWFGRSVGPWTPDTHPPAPAGGGIWRSAPGGGAR